MLSEDERERIRLEEEYRYELRRQMDGPGSRRAAVWTLLNSSFALWLLSAVFLTGVGTLYSRQQQAHTEDVRRRETIERLDLEIAYRCARILSSLYELATPDTSHVLAEGRSAADVERVLTGLRRRQAPDTESLYPEFARYELPGLIAELRRHLTDPKDRSDLDNVLGWVTTTQWTEWDQREYNSRPRLVARLVQRYVVIKRWEDQGFDFIDCPPERPFC